MEPGTGTGKGESVPEGKFTTVRGMRFHYLDWGGSRKRTMVLLHGIGDNAHIWDSFAREASRFFRIVAMDQRGHGLSSRAVPPAYRLEDYCADLEGVIEALGMNGAVIMGHSMGALHATAYVAAKPDRMAALIHVDIEPCPPGWNKKYLMNLYRDLPESYPAVEDFIAEQCRNSPFAEAARLLPQAAFALSRQDDGTYRRTFDREVLRHFDAYDLRSVLAAVGCPTLVVRGQESPVMSRAAAEEMSRAISGGRLAEVPEAAHPVMTDNPAAFRMAVLRFLEEEGLLERA